MDTEKTCRYGHGLLERTSDTWCLPKVTLIPQNEDGSVSRVAIDMTTAWSCTVLVCKTCGYIELEDKDVG